MKRSILLPITVLIVAAACEDDLDRAKASRNPTAPAFSVMGGDASAAGESTVCISFAQDLEQQKAALAQYPDSTELQEAVAATEVRIASSCE